MAAHTCNPSTWESEAVWSRASGDRNFDGGGRGADVGYNGDCSGNKGNGDDGKGSGDKLVMAGMRVGMIVRM